MNAERLRGTRLVFLATPADVSRTLAQVAEAGGARVIDTSRAFLSDLRTPVVFPRVPGGGLGRVPGAKRFRVPGPVSQTLLGCLEPLRASAGVREVSVSALIPASGAGREGVAELEQQTAGLLASRELEPTHFPHRLGFNLIPQVVEFEGFINYGSPINAVGVNTVAGISVSQPVELTPNIINQPVFSTRKVTTSVSVYDGQTVVLGGLMREDVQKTEDKVPIIGDIPLVGRAFRTNTEQHTKKNLVIFVTAKIITPAGIPLNEEEEEGLLPPELPEVPAYKK